MSDKAKIRNLKTLINPTMLDNSHYLALFFKLRHSLQDKDSCRKKVRRIA